MHRLNLELTPKQSAALQRLCGVLEDTQAGVLRQALALMLITVEGRQEGARLGFIRDGHVIREVAGVWDLVPAA